MEGVWSVVTITSYIKYMSGKREERAMSEKYKKPYFQ